MKSERAKELIEKYAVGNSRDAAPSMLKKTCILCVELAEQEAEERMRAELTRWHDPKDVLPERYKPVEVKYLVYGVLCISIAWMALLKNDGYVWTINGTTFRINGANIIGWREIHENE